MPTHHTTTDRNIMHGVAVPTRHIWTLAERLENVAPIDIDAAERAALDTLRAIAREVRDVKADRERKTKRIRPAFEAHGTAWSAAHSVLVGVAAIPDDVSERGPRARAMLDELFPKGLAFVQVDAAAAYAEGASRIDHIAAQNLREPLAQLIGEDLVTSIERATRDLGTALGAGTERRVSPNRTALRDKRSMFSRAVAKYRRLLAAKIDEDDAASVERFRSASGPIDEFRISSGKEEIAEDDTDELLTPVVPVTPEPPTE